MAYGLKASSWDPLIEAQVLTLLAVILTAFLGSKVYYLFYIVDIESKFSQTSSQDQNSWMPTKYSGNMKNYDL